jgi:hypothetical protein
LAVAVEAAQSMLLVAVVSVMALAVEAEVVAFAMFLRRR